MDTFEEQVMKSAKKSTRSLRRLCRLMKDRAGREKQLKAYDSFCRAFGEMEAYALAYLIRGKLSASKVMEVRNDIRHAMSAYLRMRHQFEKMYNERDEKGIAKADKILERKFIKTNREIMTNLSSQHPDDLDQCDPCEKRSSHHQME